MPASRRELFTELETNAIWVIAFGAFGGGEWELCVTEEQKTSQETNCSCCRLSVM